MVIYNSHGVVHNPFFAECPENPEHVRRVRVGVTNLQARVFKLPGCPTCWGDISQYQNMIRNS